MYDKDKTTCLFIEINKKVVEYMILILGNGKIINYYKKIMIKKKKK